MHDPDGRPDDLTTDDSESDFERWYDEGGARAAERAAELTAGRVESLHDAQAFLERRRESVLLRVHRSPRRELVVLAGRAILDEHGDLAEHVEIVEVANGRLVSRCELRPQELGQLAAVLLVRADAARRIAG